MATPPATDFGKRRPVIAETTPPVKRSRHVALLLMGSFAVGGGAYALMPERNCEPRSPGMAAPSPLQTGADCASRGWSGSHGGSWSRHSFFGGGSQSGAASEVRASGVTRGGFGAMARAFAAAHFSGGG